MVSSSKGMSTVVQETLKGVRCGGSVLAACLVVGGLYTGHAVGQPIALSGSEADSVTAGYVAVNVDSVAAAAGSIAITDTRAATRTRVYTRAGWVLEVGVGVGSATAVGSNGTSASVAINTLGTGDMVVAGQVSSAWNGSNSSSAVGVGYVATVTAPTASKSARVKSMDVSGYSVRRVSSNSFR